MAWERGIEKLLLSLNIVPWLFVCFCSHEPGLKGVFLWLFLLSGGVLFTPVPMGEVQCVYKTSDFKTVKCCWFPISY